MKRRDKFDMVINSIKNMISTKRKGFYHFEVTDVIDVVLKDYGSRISAGYVCSILDRWSEFSPDFIKRVDVKNNESRRSITYSVYASSTTEVTTIPYDVYAANKYSERTTPNNKLPISKRMYLSRDKKNVIMVPVSDDQSWKMYLKMFDEFRRIRSKNVNSLRKNMKLSHDITVSYATAVSFLSALLTLFPNNISRAKSGTNEKFKSHTLVIKPRDMLDAFRMEREEVGNKAVDTISPIVKQRKGRQGKLIGRQSRKTDVSQEVELLPNIKDDKPVIYVFANRRYSADGSPVNAYAMAEDGQKLATELVRDASELREVLGGYREEYRAKYPDGFSVVFVPTSEVATHEGLRKAYEKNQRR